MINNAIDTFNSLDSYFVINQGQQDLQNTINSMRYLDRNFFDRNCYPYHFTASAWIVDKKRENALLIFHNKLQLWLQPGGHSDGETNLSKVAFREAYEETGLKSLHLISTIVFDFDITPIPANNKENAHAHLDVRFLIEADNEEEIIESDETSGAKWH
jgi:8-oxo-dGTP pyrophosphatase MutT (NUDIX family)